jgi:all-trans-8'-apo-beta-carotenal 15,15'-oxygenase
MVTIIHDIAVTEHWYVVVSGPLNFEPSKFLQDYVLGR